MFMFGLLDRSHLVLEQLKFGSLSNKKLSEIDKDIEK